MILGKTATPEFGCKGETNSPLTGITRNPWNPAKTPGGSSGGTAAAVAAGMGPLSVGTDGAGSVRIPAAFCGNFGLKPSFGRVPAYPLSPMGSVAHLGPHTMSVADAALMMNVLKRPDARDWTSLPPDASDYTHGLDDGIRGLRIAFSPALGYARVDAEVAAAVATAVGALEGLGAHVERIDPGFDDPLEITTGLWFAGAWTIWNGLTAAQQELTDPDFRAEAMLGAKLSALDVQRLKLRRGARLAHAPVHAALGPARHAGGRGAGVRRAAGRPQPDGSGGDARLDALHLSVQPDPAAGLHDPVRADERRPADRPAAGRPDVRRRAGAARGARLRDRAADRAAASRRVVAHRLSVDLGRRSLAQWRAAHAAISAGIACARKS